MVSPFVHGPVQRLGGAITRHAEREVIEHHVAFGLVSVPKYNRHLIRPTELDGALHAFLSGNCRHGWHDFSEVLKPSFSFTTARLCFKPTVKGRVGRKLFSCAVSTVTQP